MHKTLLFTNLFLFILYTSFAQNPLLIPPILSGENIDLTIQQGSIEFYPGTSTATLGVNGNILGPTLILEKGQEVNITVNNLIGESTTIHWHGMHVSAANDGGPHTVIEAGETWNPQFTVLDNAATYWYHPHLHEKTNDHVLQGIAGFIIVQDDVEGALDLPRTYGINDFPIVIQTKTFDADKQIVLGANAMDTTVLVNATRNPYVDVPAEVVRLRLLNGASQRIFNLGFSNNQTFYQIGSDGGLLSQPIEMNRLMLSPGERAEILVDFSSFEGQNIFLKSYASELPTGYYGAAQVGMNSMMSIPNYNSNPLNGADFNILQLNVQEPSGGVTTIPSELVSVIPWDQNDVDTIRNLLFTPKIFGPSGMVNGPFVIDGNSFDLNVINQVIPLNNLEVWEITNQTMVAHPFHIHDVQFYLLTRNGVPVPENERGRKDVVLIPPQFGSIRFITKFEDFANDEVPYMYHCHMLTHEDEGMMGQFTVVDYSTGAHDTFADMISIYPNPTTNVVKISGLIPSVIELYNSEGKLLQRRKTINIEESFDLSSYNSGVYFFEVVSKQNNRTFRVVKD